MYVLYVLCFDRIGRIGVGLAFEFPLQVKQNNHFLANLEDDTVFCSGPRCGRSIENILAYATHL